ncbi:MAG: serine hydrolase [Patescibacteria group bacterium]
MNANTRLNILSVVIVLVCGAIVVSAWPLIFQEPQSARVSASVFCANLSPQLSLTGRAAYAEDMTTGKVLYGKNADVQLPLASLTKLMTVLTASDTLGSNDIVVISEESLSPEGDSGLTQGERWHVKDLIDFTLLTSSNDGAHALAVATQAKTKGTPEVFIQRMNEKAFSLGMVQTYFADDTGLDISENTAGAYGSARDIGKLFSYVARTHPNLIEATTAPSGTFLSLDNIAHKGKNTSSVITALSGAIGSKTGFTDIAGGNLAVIFEPLPGRAVVAVILGSTRDGRDTDMVTLANALKISLKRDILCTSDI